MCLRTQTQHEVNEDDATDFLFCAPTPKTTALVRWHIANPIARFAVCSFPRPLTGWELTCQRIPHRKLCRACHVQFDEAREFYSKNLGFLAYKGVQTSRLIRDAIYWRDGYNCVYCLEALTGLTASLDHVIPHSEGGPTIHTNLVAACRDCNSARNARPIADYPLAVQERIAAAIAKTLEIPDAAYCWPRAKATA